MVKKSEAAVTPSQTEREIISRRVKTNKPLIVGARKTVRMIQLLVKSLAVENDPSSYCKSAVELRREASRLEAIARQMARKPEGLCDVQSCFEKAFAVHRIEAPNVSPAAPVTVTLCARHSAISKFKLHREGGGS